MVVVKNESGLLILETLKSAVCYNEKLMKWADFLYADTNLGKLKLTLTIISYAGSTDHGALKSGLFHKWFDKLSGLIEWHLYTESDGYPLKLPKFAILCRHFLAYALKQPDCHIFQN